MIGLSLLLFFILALALAIWFSGWIIRLFKVKQGSTARFFLRVLIVIVLMSSFFIDEWIGGIKFDALCEQNKFMLKIPPEDAVGRKVKYVDNPNYPRVVVSSFPIEIESSRSQLNDIKTGDEIAYYVRYTTSGGWFNRKIFPIGRLSNANCNPSKELTKYGLILIR